MWPLFSYTLGDGTVRAVPCVGFGSSSAIQERLTERDGSGPGSWKTIRAVLVPLSFPEKTVPTVPGSVLAPP